MFSFDSVKEFGSNIATKIKNVDIQSAGKAIAAGAALVGSTALAVFATHKADEQIEGDGVAQTEVDTVEVETVEVPKTETTNDKPASGKSKKK